MAERECRLTLIGYHHKNKYYQKFNLYQCSCGKQVIIAEHSVKSGNTKSCGCLNRELTSKRAKNHGKEIRLNQLLGKKNKNNTSGVTGVTYDKYLKMWEATLMFNRKRHKVRCKTKEEAIEARKQMEIEFGIYEGVL